MRCAVVLSLAATVTLSSALAVPRDIQCAVCPLTVGPAEDGSMLPLTGASAQLGAPTFCMYGPSFQFQYCFFGGDGGLASHNTNLCPTKTSTTACPPHSN
ncbi:hypothetical protein AURDEDRAFT_150099 [Auricularia subglabra TFB-10046 SS5]|nr:hypothetical protein AURDEDRAFT_150099 [Auricularia subglabra TFB-10046 SS5]